MDAKRLPLVVTLLAFALNRSFYFAFSYNRPPPGKTILVSRSNDLTSISPEQVHISQVGKDKMRISWITTSDLSPAATVEYGTSSGSYEFSGTGNTTSYRYLTYISDKIHDVVIGPLNPNTVYYYRCGGSTSNPEFSFKTPPSQFPIKFAIAGDLGQTDWTRSTLEHISKSNYDMFLLPGDLSYADTDQELWDSFGRLISTLASEKPWMVTEGNHEIEILTGYHSQSFTAYNARWRMPYEESNSHSNLYYSFEVSAGVHVVMLGSYTDFDPNSPQYKWLQSDLENVDRNKTPWLFVLFHAPWYNSNTAHQGEYASFQMKVYLEDLLYKARVDAVFAGHVHAYERFTRVYKEQHNNCGPVYITVGDGGNREGLASRYINPQPNISLFREASFGHGQLEIVNGTHAHWTWHRNDDHYSVAADSVWLTTTTSSSC